MLLEQIKDKTFFEKTISELKKKNIAADVQLLEKTVVALFLVESLVEQGLEFIFKGGTSLILLLSEIKRFSIDVDIITEENDTKVKNIINCIIESQTLFTRFEENIRKNSTTQRMNIQHYKFFFNSFIDDSEKYILLDIAYETNKYSKIIEKKIENKMLNIKSNLLVKVPSIESILGDKLTVLATNTTGISFDSNKELEIIKQIYDVDKLFNEAQDISVIKNSFINISESEINYRKLKEITYKDVLEDIQNLSENIIFMKNKDNIEKINIGMKKFANYRLEKKFLIDKEILTAAAKIFYLIQLIKNNEQLIDKYNKSYIEPKNIEIPIEYRKRLKIIKKINIEAYFYIINSIKIKNKNKSLREN